MSDIKHVWSDSYYLPTYEIDLKGNATIPMLGRFMQESASNHASHLGFGHEAMVAAGTVWMLLGLAFRIERYPHWRETIEVQTWPSRHERIYYYRDFRIVCEGKSIGVASSKWIVVDLQRRRPVRDAVHFDVDWDATEQVWPECLQKLTGVESESIIDTHEVRYTDLDVNEHVNNIRYIEWILDGFPLDFHKSHQLHEFEIQFQSEGLYGDRVQLVQDSLDEVNFTHSIRQSDGKEICRARSSWKKSAEQSHFHTPS